MKTKKLAVILGIRPDIIRASIILDLLRSSGRCDLTFIWSGQHYSDNLKDVFFRELSVAPPEIELGIAGETDAETVAAVVRALAGELDRVRPAAAVFLGDTNTVMGSLAAAQLNIPVVHIEGCMRSYDWRMPEEKYRTVVDHISDVIYAYLDEYKAQGIAEGLNPANIVVTGNPIVDVLQKYYFGRLSYYRGLASKTFFQRRALEPSQYYVMTCHRRENVHDHASLRTILDLAASAKRSVYFPASYRTQRVIRAERHRVPGNVIIVDPVGYDEFLTLLTNARGVLTDSGTVVEEACILHVPAVQLRTSTERPQVYDVGACIKFDPSAPVGYPHDAVWTRFESLYRREWPNPFGDGNASERIVEDLLTRLDRGDLNHHRPRDYHYDVTRAFTGESG